jgi:curved DNA-binding protein CbpA
MPQTAACPLALLGIDKGSSRRRILKAWRKKMKTTHPDKTGKDDELAKVLNDAKDRALAFIAGGYDEDGIDGSSGCKKPGETMREVFEEAHGSKVSEEKLNQLWEILTDQTVLRDGSSQAETSKTQEKWMDKDRFKHDIFGMMLRGLQY